MKADEAFMDKRVELYLAHARTQKARVGERKHAYDGGLREQGAQLWGQATKCM